MIGTKLSKPALVALLEVKKGRGIKAFSKRAKVHFETVKKMLDGGYVALDKVRIVELELKKVQAEKVAHAHEIVRLSAEAKNVTVEDLVSERKLNRFGIYSDAEMARYIAVHLLYKNTRLPLRDIAKEVGYQDHTSVIRTLERIGGLMDVNPALRKEVLNLQKSL